MLHHTKVKADIGLTKVIADLTVKGYVVCLPLSEHQPYDLVVVISNQRILRVQVKYASLRKNGTIEVGYRRNWSDQHGVHTKWYKKDEFDYYAIYCPQKETVLYVPNSTDCPKTIRFSHAVNNQVQHVNWAENFNKIK